MSNFSTIDYAALDRPEVLIYIFHPRKEEDPTPAPGGNPDILIPVEDDTVIGARFHLAGKSNPNILFFHGNGEIVSDYDDIGPIYTKIGCNFLSVGYRGYGKSTGNPTVAAMMKDSHAIFAYVKNWLGENDYSGPLVVMGRSLGCASALELAARHKNRVDGLVIESGFTDIVSLLRLLGIELGSSFAAEDIGLNHVNKIKMFDKPTLIIHAEFDHIIPFFNGKKLFEASPNTEKMFLAVPAANHNDIFVRGFHDYMKAIEVLMEKITQKKLH